jgi:Zn-dependent protease
LWYNSANVCKKEKTLGLLQNLNLAAMFSTAIVLLLGITFHEFAHAWTATQLGDPTPRLNGRVTLNPLAHFDPLGAIMTLLTILGLAFIGWGKPVPVNPYYLRYGRRGMLLTSLAGPLSNLAMAFVGAVILRLAWVAFPQGMASAMVIGGGLWYLAFNLVALNVILAVFNLLPIPPLDGFHILEGIAPPAWDNAMAFLRQYGMWILLVLLIAGGWLTGPLYRTLAYPLLRLAGILPY